MHGLDERQTEVYIEMLGRVSALNLACWDIEGPISELTQEMVDISRKPLTDNDASKMYQMLDADVLAAFSVYRQHGVDAAAEYLVGVARKR